MLGDRVASQIRWQEIDRDVAVEAWVMGLVDDAHAARPELADDLVRPEGGARFERHQSTGTRRCSASNRFCTRMSCAAAGIDHRSGSGVASQPVRLSYA